MGQIYGSAVCTVLFSARTSAERQWGSFSARITPTKVNVKNCTGDSASTGAEKSKGSASARTALSIKMHQNSKRFQISKRKAISPCENQSKIKSKISSITSTESFKSAISTMSSDEMDQGSKIFTFRVLKRNGENFNGGLSRQQCLSILKTGLNLSEKKVFGISLVRSADRPFMMDIEFHDYISEMKDKFTARADDAEFEIELVVEKPPPPRLGENVTISIKRTRFKVRPEHVSRWVSLFGKIIEDPAYAEASDCPSVKCDDITMVAQLRKHIPGMLPAFGRKMFLQYPGQPILCGKCFEVGHVRKACTGEKIDWMTYVKVLYRERVAPKELFGDWIKKLEEEN